MQGLIPKLFIDELLSRTDIVEFIDSYVPLKKRGTSHLACCPFHNEKTPSFNVIPKKQFYHCFGCGASGNVISFAMNHLHLNFPDAVETIASRVGMQVVRDTQTSAPNEHITLYHLLLQVAEFYQRTLKTSGDVAITYLKQRGVSGDIAKRFQIGYAPMGWQVLEHAFKSVKSELISTGMLIQKDDKKTYDRYRHRIMFPIHDRRGRIIGFGGRSLDDTQKPKYLNSPETALFQKNRELYGLYQVIQLKSPITSILIVEGYMDVIGLAQHGVMNAVATLGTATSTYHIQLLQKHANQLLFCFDGDSAGQKAAWRALENCLPHLDKNLDARFIFLPSGHDPDSFIRKEGLASFSNYIKEAIPLNQFFFNTLLQDIDSSHLTGKNQLITAAIPYLVKMSDGPYKQLMIDELARITRIENHRLHQLISEKPTEASDKASAQPMNHNVKRTPLRIAIALLLQHPEVYVVAELELKALVLNDKKHYVLQKLIEQITASPTINTALLIEAWRDSPLFETINKLAAWDHQVPEDALVNEFLEIILFLTKQNHEKHIQQLMEKARHQSLTETERMELQAMLQKRHKRLPS